MTNKSIQDASGSCGRVQFFIHGAERLTLQTITPLSKWAALRSAPFHFGRQQCFAMQSIFHFPQRFSFSFGDIPQMYGDTDPQM
jgi:hypothetical protein